MAYKTVALGFGAFFVVAGFLCLLVAFCTNSWVIIQVNRSSLNIGASSSETLAAFTRYRGVFKECYDDTAATRKYVTKNYFKDELNECLNNDFVVTRRSDVTYSGEYKTRADLSIAMVVFFCLALLVCVCGFGVFCYCVCFISDAKSKKWALAIKWCGILIFIAAFFNAVGMAFFHGAEYMETQVITSNSNEVPYNLYFTLAQPSALQSATSRRYSWSYVLGWLAVFFDVLSAILMFSRGVCRNSSRKSEKEFFDVNTMNSSRSYGQRNLAYEYMEGKAPVIYEAQPPPHMISDGGAAYHEHFRGRHFDPYSRAPAPIESRAHYNYEDGGWNWQ